MRRVSKLHNHVDRLRAYEHAGLHLGELVLADLDRSAMRAATIYRTRVARPAATTISTEEKYMPHYLSYTQRSDMITTNAWERWTRNGLGLDADDRIETEKTVRDAVQNTYVEGIADSEWMAAALNRLGAAQ